MRSDLAGEWRPRSFVGVFQGLGRSRAGLSAAHAIGVARPAQSVIREQATAPARRPRWALPSANGVRRLGVPEPQSFFSPPDSPDAPGADGGRGAAGEGEYVGAGRGDAPAAGAPPVDAEAGRAGCGVGEGAAGRDAGAAGCAAGLFAAGRLAAAFLAEVAFLAAFLVVLRPVVLRAAPLRAVVLRVVFRVALLATAFLAAARRLALRPPVTAARFIAAAAALLIFFEAAAPFRFLNLRAVAMVILLLPHLPLWTKRLRIETHAAASDRTFVPSSVWSLRII